MHEGPEPYTERDEAPRERLKTAENSSGPYTHHRYRPTRWLDVKEVGTILLAQALAMALAPDEVDEDADEDIVCPNAAQNILVVRRRGCTRVPTRPFSRYA